LSNYEQAVLIGSARHAVPLGWVELPDVAEMILWSPDGKKIAVGQRELPIMLYDAANLERAPRWVDSRMGVHAIAFNADSTLIAGVKFGRGGVAVWDTVTGREVASAVWQEDMLPSISFRPDGKVVAVGWETHTIFLWDMVNEPQIIGLTDWPESGVNMSAISPDGKRIAAADGEQHLWTWDAETGLALHRWFAESFNSVFSLTFSPNNKVLATGDFDHFVKVWDYEAQHNLNSQFGHSGAVSALAFSPNGRILASGASANGTIDATVRLWRWDLQTTERYVDILQGHRIPVSSIAFSPDSQRLAFLVAGVPEESNEGQANLWLWDISGIMQGEGEAE
jgi:WD40 repeat protein